MKRFLFTGILAALALVALSGEVATTADSVTIFRIKIQIDDRLIFWEDAAAMLSKEPVVSRCSSSAPPQSTASWWPSRMRSKALPTAWSPEAHAPAGESDLAFVVLHQVGPFGEHDLPLAGRVKEGNQNRGGPRFPFGVDARGAGGQMGPELVGEVGHASTLTFYGGALSSRIVSWFGLFYTIQPQVRL